MHCKLQAVVIQDKRYMCSEMFDSGAIYSRAMLIPYF